MALPLLIRQSMRPEGFQNMLKLSSIFAKNSAGFSQLTCNATKLNLASKVNVLPIQPKFRNISLTPIRKSAHGDHSKLWTIERGLSVALIGLIPAALISPCTLFDNLVAVTIVAHQHWGIEACVVDYVRPIIFGNTVPKIALGALYVLSFLTLGGLLYFNHHDVGLGMAVRKFWALKAN